MTPMTTNPTVLDFAAIEQIRAKARVERSKAFWALWAAARAVVATRFAGTDGAHLATEARA